MKIAFIGTAHPFRGGLATFNHRLVQELLSQNHEVIIYNFSLQYPNFLFPGKTQYTQEPAPQNLKIISCINSINPFNWSNVALAIKKEKYDLVLVKYWMPFMAPCFGTILRKIKKNTSTTVIAIIDNIIPHEKRVGDNWLTTYFVKSVDGFLVMSEKVYQQINFFDKQKPKIYFPHPIFDNFGKIEKRELALEKLNLSERFRYALFFGFIRDYKGLDLLLEAFADKRFRNTHIKLLVVGEYYSDKQIYQDIIKKHKLENDVIQMDQFIEDSEVANYFNACDVIIQPYKNATQSGVTQIAYHFNKPMIVTNVGGLKEICPDGKVGYVVEPHSHEIADAIYRFFFSTDKNQMQKNLEFYKKRYSWNSFVNHIFQLYQKIN